jgi:stage V sporulation protein S
MTELPTEERTTGQFPNVPLEPCCAGQKPLRVAAVSQPKKVAGAIAGQLRESGCAELHAVGPEAVNQTVKSVALAKSYLAGEGIRLNIEIDFMIVDINGAERNGIRFCVRRRAERSDEG